MANKAWYESLNSGDCISSHSTWNDMVDYIKHSACTDFTIHTTCTSTGQAFRFTQNGTISTMYGGSNSGDGLIIKSTSAKKREIKVTTTTTEIKAVFTCDFNGKITFNISCLASVINLVILPIKLFPIFYFIF